MKFKYVFFITLLSFFLISVPQLVFSAYQLQQTQIDSQISTYTQVTITTAEGVAEEIMYQTAEGVFSYRNVTGLEYDGYIIQFKEEPVFVYKMELEEKIERREQRLETSHPAYTYTIGLVESATVSYDKWALEGRVNNQKNKIQREHSSLKDYAKETSIPTGQAAAVATGSEIISTGEEEVLDEYTDLFNGMALNISDSEAQTLKESRYVKDVYPNYKVNISLMDSVPLIGADEAWDLGYTGEGVTIAVIDTGIAYTHPDLGGCFGAGCKVVDGYDFVNQDSDPMDDHGHGTHCAATAAGDGTLKGVAPDAKLYAYKVLDSGGGGWLSDVIAGVERATDPNQDGDYSDHVDVISMSLGADCGRVYSEYCGPDDPMSQAVDAAVDAGVVAVIAAGNSGPREKSIGSPGTARKAITVGASYNDDDIGTDSELVISSTQETIDSVPLSIVTPDELPIVTEVLHATYGYPSNFTGQDFTGKIALISESSIGGWENLLYIRDKIKNANDAGASGVIIYSNWHGPLSDAVIEGEGIIPAVYIRMLDGLDLVDLIEQGGLEVSMEITNNPDNVVYFSSRGPTSAGIKPDIVAPGVSICAAQWEDAYLVYGAPQCLDDEHVSIKGTSMATPHVAGVAALVLQTHPDWAPYEIKAALTATAVDLGLDATTQGSGRVDALEAIQLADKPPVAFLSVPTKIRGATIDISGTSTAGGFESYTVYYGVGSLSSVPLENIEWNEICTSITQVDNGVLCEWDASTLDDGEYILKLITRSQTHDNEYVAFTEIVNTEITDPEDLRDAEWPERGEITPWWEGTIVIKGSSTGYNFDYYTLEWCTDWPEDLEEPLYCSDEGISLTKGGSSLVEDGTLGSWDISSLENSDFYYIKLTTHYTDKNDVIYYAKIYIEMHLLEGWPRPVSINVMGGGGMMMALSFIEQPTIADIDNDGKDDLAIAYGQHIYVFKYDGTWAEGWPKKVETYCGWEATVQNGPAVADLDKDDYNELVVSDNCGYLHVLNHDGTYVSGWPKKIGYTYLNMASIGDLDNDGDFDIVVGDWLSYLHAVDINGNYLPGNWPKELLPSYDSSQHPMMRGAPSIADLNGDGYKEIVVVSMGSRPPYSGYPDTSTRIWILDYKGNELTGWPKEFFNGGSIGSYPAIADVDNDEELEIIIVSMGSMVEDSPSEWLDEYNVLLHVWNLDGSDADGWPVTITKCYSPCMGMPSIGDIDKDGNLEIVVVGGHDIYEEVFVFENDGSLVEGFPIFRDGIDVGGDPIIGNLDYDERPEISVSSRGASGGLAWRDEGYLVRLYAFNSDGTNVEHFPLMLDGLSLGYGLPIGDLNGDGENEVMAYSWSGNLFVWSIPSAFTEYGNEWTEFRHDEMHTSLYEKVLVPPLTPTCTIPSSPNCDVGTTCECEVTICQSGWLRARLPDNTELVKYFTAGSVAFNTGSATGDGIGYISCRDDEKEYSVDIYVNLPEQYLRQFILVEKDSNLVVVAEDIANERDYDILGVEGDAKDIRNQIIDFISSSSNSYKSMVIFGDSIPYYDSVQLKELLEEQGLVTYDPDAYDNSLDSIYYGNIDNDPFVELSVGRIPFSSQNDIVAYYDNFIDSKQVNTINVARLLSDPAPIDISSIKTQLINYEVDNYKESNPLHKNDINAFLESSDLFEYHTHGSNTAFVICVGSSCESDRYYYSTDIPNIKPNKPIILGGACYNANELGKDFLRKGALSYFGFMVPGPHPNIKPFVSGTTDKNIGNALKESINKDIVRTKVDGTNAYYSPIWILFGDPSLNVEMKPIDGSWKVEIIYENGKLILNVPPSKEFTYEIGGIAHKSISSDIYSLSIIKNFYDYLLENDYYETPNYLILPCDSLDSYPSSIARCWDLKELGYADAPFDYGVLYSKGPDHRNAIVVELEEMEISYITSIYQEIDGTKYYFSDLTEFGVVKDDNKPFLYISESVKDKYDLIKNSGFLNGRKIVVEYVR